MKDINSILGYFVIIGLIVILVILFMSCNTPHQLYSTEWTMKFGFTTLEEDQGTIFEIQSSNDGVNFFEKASFDGIGHPNKYEIDIPYAAGGFYRLKVIDRDNVVWYSNVVK